MSDTKKIAVIARDRQGEALRVACGLTLADDIVEVYILDRILDRQEAEVAHPLELAMELELTMYSNNAENGYTTITLDEMAQKLLEYDIVVPY